MKTYFSSRTALNPWQKKVRTFFGCFCFLDSMWGSNHVYSCLQLRSYIYRYKYAFNFSTYSKVPPPLHGPTFWAKFSDPRVGPLRGDCKNLFPLPGFLGALRAAHHTLASVLWEGTDFFFLEQNCQKKKQMGNKCFSRSFKNVFFNATLTCESL